MGCESPNFLTATDARNASRDYSIIYQEICEIQQQILAATSNCVSTAAYSVVITDSPITSHYGIKGVNIVNGGTGYTASSPTVDVTSTLGTGFVGTLVIDNLSGTILDVGITAGGQDYEVGDVVVVTSSLGSGFSATVATVDTVTVLGAIQGILIVDGGVGYFDSPHLIITDINDGSDFVGELTVTGGVITAVTIVEDGSNYSSSTTVSVAGDGIDAMFTLTMDSQKWMSIPYSELYYQVWAGLVTDTPISDQIDYIQTYFTNLGYQFIIQQNPLTMTTLQFQISW